MCVEEAEEDALHADSEARDSKIRDQYDHIQALEQQLREMEEVANQGKNSTQLIQHWIDTGKVEVDDNHVPNIVGNADDQNEMSMKLSK